MKRQVQIKVNGIYVSVVHGVLISSCSLSRPRPFAVSEYSQQQNLQLCILQSVGFKVIVSEVKEASF
jgi:hypothetical protein